MNTPPQNNAMGTTMLAIFWLGVIVFLGFYFFGEEQERINPNQEPQLIQKNGQQTLVLTPNQLGHFVMTGKINDKAATLLLDTGATLVSVPATLADKLSLERGRAGTAITANGAVTVYETHIDRLELGNFLLTDVKASINPGLNGMNEILLGMSALSRLDFTQSDGNLELTLNAR